jgi:hypothetical protein
MMEDIRVPARKVVGRERLQFIVFGLITVLAGSVSSKLFAAPQGIDEQGQETSVQEREAPVPTPVATTLDWKSQARLHHGLGGSPGTLTLSQDGLVFHPAKGSTLHWPFVEIQTFDLLNPRLLVITGYENLSWHEHGERKYRLDLSVAMPPDIAAELARRVAKPVRNADPNPSATSFATIPARHRTLAGGTNGILHFGPDGIDYLIADGKGGRSWRWSDIQTLAKPDLFQLRVNSYRETFTFELKQPMSRELFDRLWDEIYAHDVEWQRLQWVEEKPMRRHRWLANKVIISSKKLQRRDTRHAT